MSVDPSSDCPSGTASASASSTCQDEPQSPNESSVNLSTLDKIKRFFFSKEEWEAYLIERLEEETGVKTKGGKSAVKVTSIDEASDRRSVVSWIKTVFPSQDDANTFLKSQLEKLQQERSGQADQTSQQTNTGTTTSSKSSNISKNF